LRTNPVSRVCVCVCVFVCVFVGCDDWALGLAFLKRDETLLPHTPQTFIFTKRTNSHEGQDTLKQVWKIDRH